MIPKGGADGVVISQGGLFGGWSLYIKNGKPKFVYNWLAREKYMIEVNERYPRARSLWSTTSPTTAAGCTRAAPALSLVNGKKVGEGRIEKTMGAVYSLAAETADVGMEPTPL